MEEVDGGWCGHGEVMAETVVCFVDWCGFDFFDAVQEPVEADEGVVVLDSDLAVGNFRVDSVFVEEGSDFWLSCDDVDDGGEVVDGVHFLVPFLVLCQDPLPDGFIVL